MESLGDIYKNIKLQKSKNSGDLREMKQQSSLSECKICNGIGWLGEDVEIQVEVEVIYISQLTILTLTRTINNTNNTVYVMR